MSEKKINIEEVKKELNAVSPSFCLAKWHQVTIHLHNGTTHSCHHPKTHKIPLEELKENPSALHNTKFKIEQRKKMIDGVRPQECDYCWRVEDAPGENTSDRMLKSSFSWSHPFKKEVLDNPLNENFYPRYVEVNMGDICNFKCSYCGPEVSTKWMAEIQQHGPYPTSGEHLKLDYLAIPIRNDEENPYIKAWWAWWPELYPHLHTFRITGGEPLLNKNLYKTLDWIEKRDIDINKEMILAINTNLCPDEKQWSRFLESIKIITEKKLVKRLDIYTSAEAWGEKSDYIRHGMNFELWKSRVWQILEQFPSVQVTVMATYNALSVTSFGRLLEEVQKIKATESFYNEDRKVPIFIDISYLRHPEHQSVQILPAEYGLMINEQVAYMKKHVEKYLESERKHQRGFFPFEAGKMERIANLFESTKNNNDKERKITQNDFYKFFSEHDRRRGTDFLGTFPEMKDFWLYCKGL